MTLSPAVLATGRASPERQARMTVSAIPAAWAVERIAGASIPATAKHAGNQSELWRFHSEPREVEHSFRQQPAPPGKKTWTDTTIALVLARVEPGANRAAFRNIKTVP